MSDCGCQEKTWRDLQYQGWTLGIGTLITAWAGAHFGPTVGAATGVTFGGFSMGFKNEPRLTCQCGPNSCNCAWEEPDVYKKYDNFYEKGSYDQWPEEWNSTKENDFYTSDPLVIDLNCDGKTDLSNSIFFDLDANGFAEQTAWVGNADGVLVMDRNGDGIINDGTEIFGDRTVKRDGSIATSGFDALRDLDSNGDGVIDLNDEYFADLRILTDINGDGMFGRSEYLTLEEAEITSISVSNTSKGGDIQGGATGNAGTFTWSDGENGLIQEVFPDRTPMFSTALEEVDIPENVASLPNINGAGILYSLHQAMARDTTGKIKNALDAYISAPRGVEKKNCLDQLLYTWAGVEDIDPGSRYRSGGTSYGYIDARKLEFLEKFMGEKFYGNLGSIPNMVAVGILESLYQSIAGYAEAVLLMQADLPDFFQNIEIKIDSETQMSFMDLEPAFAYLETLWDQDQPVAYIKIEVLKKVFVEMGILDGGNNETLFQEALVQRFPNIANMLTSNAIFGVEGEDTIGSKGNDRIIGGIGDNILRGDAGSDTYIWNLGDGNDTIKDGSSTHFRTAF